MKDKIIPVILSAVILATGIGLFAWGVHNENKKNEEPKEDTTTPIVTTVTEPVEVTEPTVTTVTEESTVSSINPEDLELPPYYIQDSDVNYKLYNDNTAAQNIPLGDIVTMQFGQALYEYQDVPLNMTTYTCNFNTKFAGMYGEPSFYKGANETFEYVAFRTIVSGYLRCGIEGIKSDIPYEDTEAAQLRIDEYILAIENELGVEFKPLKFDERACSEKDVADVKVNYSDMSSLDIAKDGYGRLLATSTDGKAFVEVNAIPTENVFENTAVILAVYIYP